MTFCLAVISSALLGLAGYWTTRLLFPRLAGDGHPLAAPIRLMLGTAVYTCVLNLLLHFMAGQVAAWVVLAAALAAGVWGLLRRKAFGALTPDGPGKSATFLELGIVSLLATVFVTWRLWPALDLGLLTPFEGTGNHDELYYIFLADWLKEHAVLAPIEVAGDFPFSTAAAMSIGDQGRLPRFGAESLLVLIAVVGRLTSPQAYVVTATIGALLLAFASSWLLLKDLSIRGATLGLALAVVMLNPVALFAFANGNLATIFGLVFLAGYYWFLDDSLQRAGERSSLFAASIFLAALLATYPELLLVASVSTLVQVVVAARWAGCPTLFRSTGVAARAALLSLLLAPASLFHVAKVLATHVSTISEPYAKTAWDRLFLDPSIVDSVLLATSLADSTVFKAHAIVATGVAGALVVVPFFRARRFLLPSLGLLLGAATVLALFGLRGYGYGLMKGVQFLALPLAGIYGAVAASLVRDVIRSLHSDSIVCVRIAAACFISLLVPGWFLGVSVVRSGEYITVARSKHLSRELLELGSIGKLLGPNARLYVDGDLGPATFLASRWIAYLVRDVPLVYAPPLHAGGYIYSLDGAFEERSHGITHILTRAGNIAYGSARLLYSNSAFEVRLHDPSLPIVTLGTGFHDWEGSSRWMGDRAVITLIGTMHPGILRVQVLGRFAKATGDEAIFVKSGQGSQRFPLPAGRGQLLIRIDGAPMQKVELVSGLMATSPKESGEGTDPRKLSFRIGRVEVLGLHEPPRVQLSNGFHDDEGGRRWMGQSGEIEVTGRCARALNIEVIERFRGARGPNTLKVEVGGESKSVPLAQGRTQLRMELPEREQQVVRLFPNFKAASPAELGLSGDPRQLTISVGRVDIEGSRPRPDGTCERTATPLVTATPPGIK